MIARWLSLLAARALLRAVTLVLAWTLVAAAGIAAAPVTIVAAGAYAIASLGGWQPRRLLVAAAWCAPMVAVWLAWIARTTPAWPDVLAAPYDAWLACWRLVTTGDLARAAATVAPPAIPLGMVAGAAAWRYRIGSLSSGAGGLSPGSAVAFDQRQWRHQVRSASARINAPGSVPLTVRGDLLIAGAVIRTVGHRAGRLAAIGYQRMRSHQVVVGTTGTGKPTPASRYA